MISFIPFITLVLSGVAVASPFKSAGAVYLSRRQSIATADCPDASQLSFVEDAHTEALDLANGATAFITANGGSQAPFTTYFGTVDDTTSISQVFFSAVNARNSITFHCTDSAERCATPTVDGFPAYVLSNDIFFCPSFYDEVNTGSLCRQRTVDEGGIRGSTALTVLIQDLAAIGHNPNAQDCLSARNLASTNPGAARNNAVNYSCFAMQAFVNTNCS